MSPQNTRYDARDYKQAQPYVAGGPDLAYNPYFDRYDPITDPRNAIRELRSAVYEDKGGDQGYQESQKKLKRHFENRWVPEEIVTDDLMDTFLRYDTVLPNIKSDNKYSSKNIKNGLFDPNTFKSPEICGEIMRLKTFKPTVTMKDQINILLKRQKIQDIEDKKNIEVHKKAFDNIKTIQLKNNPFKGYAFQICMKYATLKHGFKVRELPIVFVDRLHGTSKMSTGIFKEAIFGIWKMKKLKL
jgi:hypothetical protein